MSRRGRARAPHGLPIKEVLRRMRSRCDNGGLSKVQGRYLCNLIEDLHDQKTDLMRHTTPGKWYYWMVEEGPFPIHSGGPGEEMIPIGTVHTLADAEYICTTRNRTLDEI